MKKYYQFFRVSLLTISIAIFMNYVLHAQSPITVFKNESGKYGFKKDNRIIIAPKYDSAYNFEDHLARVKLNNKWGYIDETGKETIPIKFFWVQPAVFMNVMDGSGNE